MMNRSRLGQLSDLIDKLSWEKIETVYRRSGHPPMTPEDLIVIFESNNKKKYLDKIDQVRLRIGRKIIDQLGWKMGDKIIPLFNPDDQMFFLLVKSDNGKGFTLGSDGKADIHKLTFKWTRDFPLLELRNEKVTYEIYKRQLLFKM